MFENLFNNQIKNTPVISTTNAPVKNPTAKTNMFAGIFDNQPAITSISPTVQQPTNIFDTVKNSFPQTIETAKTVAQDIYNVGKNPLSVIPNFGDIANAAKSVWTTLSKTIPQDNAKRIIDFIQTFKTPTTTSTKVGKGIEAAMTIPNTVLSPITGLFSATEQIPTLKPLADLISLPFVAIGEGGAKVLSSAFDTLPFNQKTKISLNQGIKEIGSLASQLLLGAGIHKIGEAIHPLKIEIIKKNPELTKYIEKIPESTAQKLVTNYGEADAKTIITKATQQASNLLKEPEAIKLLEIPKVSEPIIGKGFTMAKKVNKENLETAKIINNFREAVTNFNDKPTPAKLKTVIAAKTALNDIISKAKTAQNNPIIIPQTPEIAKVEPMATETEIKPSEAILSEKQAPKTVNYQPTPVKPVETARIVNVTGEKSAGIAKSIEVKSVEKGLTDRGFDKLAGYDPVVIKEQAQMMSDLMKSDIEKAKRIATGKEELPQGLKGTTALTAMEDYAMETKNGALAAELAKSPLVSETSIAGQTLRLTAEREPDSAVAKMREVIKEREKAISKKTKGKSADKLVADIKKSLQERIENSKPTKKTWEAFVESIVC